MADPELSAAEPSEREAKALQELRRSVAQRDLYFRELTKTNQRFEEKVRELSVVRRIGESLKYTRDVQKVFEVIIDTIIDETNAENCSLWLLNKESGELSVKAAGGRWMRRSATTTRHLERTGSDSVKESRVGSPSTVNRSPFRNRRRARW